MVKDEGQLYTIEGVAAAVLLIVTAYVILNSTSLFTPGDTHINDMQLEQLGNDVLRMMDTSDSYNYTAISIYDKKISPLEISIAAGDITLYEQEFYQYANETPQSLKIYSTIYHSDGRPGIPFSAAPQPTYREHFVTVTRWVNLENEVVLLEVLLWRD